jgi:FkbM family methyltransferase
MHSLKSWLKRMLAQCYRSSAMAWFRPIWRLMKAACVSCWHFLRDPLDRGIQLCFGGHPLRVPVEFANRWASEYVNYEFTAAETFARWVATKQNPLILDVGCELGQYSLLALEVNPSAEVIAFDAGLGCLEATAATCRLVAGTKRLQLVYGLLSSDGEAKSLSDAIISTETAIRQSAGIAPSFVCLDSPDASTIPHYSLSRLLQKAVPPDRPLLLKCDVEGAELKVLKGATALLESHRPCLMLSVHPHLLPAYEATRDDVAVWLIQNGYYWRLISTDHEEHWLCESITKED